jgi:7-carboxy-7-deazaguanine synthase
MTYQLAPNAIFWTLQGEGAQLGEPMCFVRLAGCSVGCAQCDTNYSLSVEKSVEEILEGIKKVIPPAFTWPWVWITGGEPTDQNIHPLLDALRTLNYRVALATSGIRALPQETMSLIQWLSVSPHFADFPQGIGHEVKLVPGLGGLTWENLPVRECGNFPWKYIQPLPTPGEAKKGIAWVQNNPGWRLTPQAHKFWRIP